MGNPLDHIRGHGGILGGMAQQPGPCPHSLPFYLEKRTARKTLLNMRQHLPLVLRAEASVKQVVTG
jgi:hypothetical protein